MLGRRTEAPRGPRRLGVVLRLPGVGAVEQPRDRAAARADPRPRRRGGHAPARAAHGRARRPRLERVGRDRRADRERSAAAGERPPPAGAAAGRLDTDAPAGARLRRARGRADLRAGDRARRHHPARLGRHERDRRRPGPVRGRRRRRDRRAAGADRGPRRDRAARARGARDAARPHPRPGPRRRHRDRVRGRRASVRPAVGGHRARPAPDHGPADRRGRATSPRSATPSREVGCPGQNFVYADADGHIGVQVTGAHPIRRHGDGTVPLPDHGWDGWIPAAELPWRLDPERRRDRERERRAPRGGGPST